MASPETHGCCERFHRTLKEEFFAVAFRKTLYESLDQLQADLDRYLEFCNHERAHQGYRTQGRTPYQAFLDGVKSMTQEAAAGVNITCHRNSPVSGDLQLSTHKTRKRPHFDPPILQGGRSAVRLGQFYLIEEQVPRLRSE